MAVWFLAWHNGLTTSKPSAAGGMAVHRDVVKECARKLGFDLVGVTSAERFSREEAIVLERLGQGFMGQLSWYTEARVRRGCDPDQLLPGARSIISVAVSYLTEPPARQEGGLCGRVARYAWGQDYHQVLKRRLKEFVRELSARLGTAFRYKTYVDDGPMLDREVARRAGVGFIGKNTNVLTPIGSWVFLGQVITDLVVEPDRPLQKSCGSCRACIPACPTGAIVSSYVLDSNRCISYLTIEHRGSIPRELRPLMGDWVFGCDICQEVCPVNITRGRATQEPAFHARRELAFPDLRELLTLTEEEFRLRFQGSPVRRATRIGLQRNACVALGNLEDPRAVPDLTKALQEAAPVVRGHAAWALGRIGGNEARQALEETLATELDAVVREEIALALSVVRALEEVPAITSR
ncbi:MAG: tRNA epoxyqueuosine(34) reductase QueG [Chloroflexi bacterium]|nr:tRNA epoxyqueuosine(34) reductase QueG [Chloroflexota bacterium]